MTTPIQYPLINGVRHEFASVELKLAGTIFVGVKSIEYSRKRERTKPYGTHPDPLGKTRGKNSYDGSIDLYLAEWNAFVMNQLGGAGYGDVIFPIFVTYSENGFDTITDQLIGCTLDTSEAKASDGTEALTRKFDLSPIKILFNGVDDLATPLTGSPSTPFSIGALSNLLG